MSSWHKRYCVAAFIVLRHWRLLLYILIDIQFGISCFCLHVLLYHSTRLVPHNFFYIPILILCTVIQLCNVVPCTVIQLCNVPCTVIQLCNDVPCTVIQLCNILPCTVIQLCNVVPCTVIQLCNVVPCTVIQLCNFN